MTVHLLAIKKGFLRKKIILRGDGIIWGVNLNWWEKIVFDPYNFLQTHFDRKKFSSKSLRLMFLFNKKLLFLTAPRPRPPSLLRTKMQKDQLANQIKTFMSQNLCFFWFWKWGGLVQLKKIPGYSSTNEPLTNFVSFQEENVDLIIGKISTPFQLHTTMKHETQQTL